MDISVRTFIAPDEYIRFLEHVSTERGAILYTPTEGAAYQRVEPGAPLPEDLVSLVSSPREVDSPHLIFIGVDDPASNPRDLVPNRTISAYFGGFDQRALYISPISVRSNDEQTLGLMRRLVKWLKSISRTGLQAWGEPVEPGDRGQADRSARFTDGALRLARSGLQLRQRGVGRVHFEIVT
jgi:hypothetical protein